MSLSPHPDRLATTLAERQLLLARGEKGPWQAPGSGIVDARVDLCRYRDAARRALETRGNDAAREWLAGLDTPDLRAGSIQDGTARGLMARLEEAISLCDPAESEPARIIDEEHAPLTPVQLRRKREYLVASGGARIRFSRRMGILLVHRREEIHSEKCVQFEDLSDQGCLDEFRPVPGERPRLFSPAFLTPVEYHQTTEGDRLELEGRLGRRISGYPCRLTLEGHKSEQGIRMRLRFENHHRNHRLRIRFWGLPPTGYISHRGTPGFTSVETPTRSFVTATLVRACGRLKVGDSYVATPGAQVLSTIKHEFGLGVVV